MVPLRIEPKTFFGTSRLCTKLGPRFGVAGWGHRREPCCTLLPCCGRLCSCLSAWRCSGAANERTFLSWVSMAITIGGVSTALVGFQSEDGGGANAHTLLARYTLGIVLHKVLVFVLISLPMGMTRASLPRRASNRSCGGIGHESGPITPGTTDLITILLTPVAIAMVIYALFCFYWRSVFLRKKQVRRLSVRVAVQALLCTASAAGAVFAHPQ